MAFLFFSFCSSIRFAESVVALEVKGRLVMFGGLATGLVIVEALTFIPYVRFLVCLANCILGVGAMLLMLKGEWEGMRKG